MIEHDVVVVGAGPVGLTAALAVRATGRPVIVIEAGAADRIRPGSRAIFIHRESLQVLDRIRPRLGHELTDRGLVWLTKRTFYRGRLIYQRSYRPPDPAQLPAATSLAQVVTEQLLVAACIEHGVQFVWNTPVTRVTTDESGVRIQSETGWSTSARYLIGADGAHSAVRSAIAAELEGPRTTNAFVIVDAAEDAANPLPVERVFHYEHPAIDGRNVLFVPFAGHWRIDLQCFADDDPETFSGVDGVKRWLPRVMPAKYAERITWVSTYVFRQAIANRFVDENSRVLLAGEAAHLFAPFGARGLNSGIADAYVAASAIDAALRVNTPSDSAAAIAGFAASRRAAAVRNRAASSVALRHMIGPTFSSRVVRFAAGHLAPAVPAIARWMDQAPYGPVLGEPDAQGMRY